MPHWITTCAMAQAKHNLPEKSSGTLKEKEKDNSEDKEGSVTIPECAVCLQPCIHPARLPCNHIYCYLCVKGVANHNKKCPMCRQEMPPDFVERPQLVEVDEVQKELERPDEEYQWFYEGRNGWWKYDSRTSQDLETVYKLGDTECEILICGMLYMIDFKNKCQYRKYQPRYKRNIKRDKKDAECKGVSGVR